MLKQKAGSFLRNDQRLMCEALRHLTRALLRNFSFFLSIFFLFYSNALEQRAWNGLNQRRKEKKTSLTRIHSPEVVFLLPFLLFAASLLKTLRTLFFFILLSCCFLRYTAWCRNQFLKKLQVKLSWKFNKVKKSLSLSYFLSLCFQSRSSASLNAIEQTFLLL
jgi:hypothetical protein